MKVPFSGYAFAVYFLFLAAGPTRADFLVKPNDVIAICGDSITEQRIYSAYIEDYLLMCQPAHAQRILQFGFGGGTTPGFFSNLKPCLFPFKPTIVMTCYGMNDGNYKPVDQATLDLYRDITTQVITSFKENGVRDVVLASPGCVDSTIFNVNNTPPAVYNQTLDAIRGVAREVAEKEGVHFADVHTPMMEVMAKAKAAYGESYPFVIG